MPTTAPTTGPTSEPTPTPAPTVNFTVRIQQTTPMPANHGDYAFFRVDAAQNAVCYLTRSGNGQSTIDTSAYPYTVGYYGYFLPKWGGGSSAWPAGTYSISATCTLSGVTKTSTRISVTMP